MNKAALVSSFTGVAVVLLALQLIATFGYSGVKPLVILSLVAVVAIVVAGIRTVVGAALGLVVYYLVDYGLHDKLLAAAALAALAAAASVAAGRGTFWHR